MDIDSLRSYRVFGIAVFDVAVTGLLAEAISKLTHQKFLLVFLFLVVFGEVVHWVMNVKTAGLDLLGVDQNSDLGKLVIAA